jgi:hypothetical protein
MPAVRTESFPKTTAGIKVKHKVHEDVRGTGGIAPPFLTSALDGGERSTSSPGHFTPRERAAGTHWIGG